jgi:hypothetical protein
MYSRQVPSARGDESRSTLRSGTASAPLWPIPLAVMPTFADNLRTVANVGASSEVQCREDRRRSHSSRLNRPDNKGQVITADATRMANRGCGALPLWRSVWRRPTMIAPRCVIKPGRCVIKNAAAGLYRVMIPKRRGNDGSDFDESVIPTDRNYHRRKELWREKSALRACSSMAERGTHNPLVAGSSPARPISDRREREGTARYKWRQNMELRRRPGHSPGLFVCPSEDRKGQQSP